MQVRKVTRTHTVPAGLDASVEHAGELRAAQRADGDIRTDILRRVEGYTGDADCWDVRVSEGVVTVRRAWGAPQISRAVEEFAIERLARTVPGVVAVESSRPPRSRVRRRSDEGTEAT